MNKIVNFENIKENSIYDQLKERLFEQKEKDNKFQEDTSLLEEEYERHFNKLDNAFKTNEEIDVNRVVDVIGKMENLEGLSGKQKLIMILSYGTLINQFTKIHDRNNEELMFLSASSSSLDLEDYTYYIGILSDANVSQSIGGKTQKLSEQVNICYSVMDAQDDFPYDYLTPDNFDELTNNALSVINSYELGHTK